MRHPGILVLPATLMVALPFVASLVALGGYSLSGGANGFGLHHWSAFLGDGFYWRIIGRTATLALLVTGITLVLAYPTAAALAALRNPLLRSVAYTIIFAPLLISVIVRTYGWLLLLSDSGMVNQVVAAFGVDPIRLIHNRTGVVIALVHVMLPFAVFPILSLFSQLPESYREAALDLGASRWAVFLKVTLPLTLPGIVAAGEIIFALAVSSFVTPALLGGGRVLVLSGLVYSNIGNLAWAEASVQALTLLAMAVLVLLAFRRLGRTIRPMPEGGW